MLNDSITSQAISIKSSIKTIIKENYKNIKQKEIMIYLMVFQIGRKYISSTYIIKNYFYPYKRVLCSPRNFSPNSVFSRIFAINGYKPVFDPNTPHDFSILVPSSAEVKVINANHKGNRKSRVSSAWESVAEYKLAVDPTQYSGAMVEKSEANARHDGRVVYGPLSDNEIVPKKVYQLLINNTDGNDAVDLRVAINGRHLTLVYVRYRPINNRFADNNSFASIEYADAIFTQDEQDKILACAEQLGLDHGEADILRDKATGLIYLVDTTHDASVTPSGMSFAEEKLAMFLIARDFEKYLAN
jgi:hypothetical protein